MEKDTKEIVEIYNNIDKKIHLNKAFDLAKVKPLINDF